MPFAFFVETAGFDKTFRHAMKNEAKHSLWKG
jgi:hypothetical protein